ncbi:phage head morphogenesis protein [Kaistia algarum]|uniref:phage head morphogenesis protein n=1 Tax=Kaistia algarum TaxID=2083279 RepID=UPI002254B97C|nr:phage minor head protein [Kaistia algarum]MCX5516222.1 phage minor head protein [Kaistia algarum]
MISDVSRRDERMWKDASKEIGRLLRAEIGQSEVGRAMRAALDRQTALITSLPTEAADRVRKLTLEGITTGRRATDIADEIMRTGEVTKSRATLIARTEVSRTATELTKARAESIGSTQFIWRTVGDSDVRPTHRVLNGKAFRWDDPPECDPGHHALPGAIWNCRCWAEPIIPED